MGFQKIPVTIPRGLLEIRRKVRAKTGNSRGIGEGRFWNNTLKYSLTDNDIQKHLFLLGTINCS